MKKENKIILLLCVLVAILVVVVGVESKFLINMFQVKEKTHYEPNGNTSKKIESGSISLLSKNNTLVLDDMSKNTIYKPTSYIEFTIKGNNYYNDDTPYKIVLNYGSSPENKTIRIDDSFLRFKLQEIGNEKVKNIFTNRSYTSLSNQTIFTDVISKNTSFSKTYRLYMFVDNDILVGGDNALYQTNEFFNDVYASIKVSIQVNQ